MVYACQRNPMIIIIIIKLGLVSFTYPKNISLHKNLYYGLCKREKKD